MTGYTTPNGTPCQPNGDPIGTVYCGHGLSASIEPSARHLHVPLPFEYPAVQDLSKVPTQDTFKAYEHMFDFFNARLFAGKLPKVILNFSRHSGTLGFFAPQRWARQADGAVTHEISLNPETNASRDPRDIASTLVHEMVHLEQEVFGKPSKGGYHNKEWAAWMKKVGLQPVSYDNPGREVGYSCSHTIIAGDKFDVAFLALPVKAMPWRHRSFAERAAGILLPPAGPSGGPVVTPKPVKKNKTSYKCGCSKVWGKPGLDMTCNDCGQEFVEQE